MTQKEEVSNIHISTEKNFGQVFFLVFILISAYLFLNNSELYKYCLSLAPVILLIAYIRPSLLTIPNILWHKFGLLLGKIVSPVAIMVVFIAAVMPTGLVMRLLGKDLLRIKDQKKKSSNWIKRDVQPGSMKNQF